MDAWRPSVGWLVAAAVTVAAGVGLAWRDPAEPVAEVVVAQATVPASAAPPAPAPVATVVPAPAAPPAAIAPAIPRLRDPGGDQTPDISDYINPGEVPTMGEVIARLNQAGVHTGLGAFQPPGTRPPLVGLAVPEDFPLPPGYVRHYQATDDGQRIEAVLMFSPDQPPLDAAGRPLPVTADRVVPPELAPPGLPQRRIVVPPPARQ